MSGLLNLVPLDERVNVPLAEAQCSPHAYRCKAPFAPLCPYGALRQAEQLAYLASGHEPVGAT
jgi:hypothetical protein